MNDTLDLILVIGGILVGTMFLIVVLMNVSCSAYGANTKYQTRFSLLGGGSDSCLMLVKGQWIPTDKWILNTGN